MEGTMTDHTNKHPAAEVGDSGGAISGYWNDRADQHGHPNLGLAEAPAKRRRKKAPTWEEQEAAKKARADQVIACLARLWPNCFCLDEEQRRPLKVGIGEQLLEVMEPAIRAGRISTHDIAVALSHYVNGRGYLENCTFNADRIGLDGKVAGRVSLRQSLFAAERLRVGRF
jgi:hypothetical protein